MTFDCWKDTFNSRNIMAVFLFQLPFQTPNKSRSRISVLRPEIQYYTERVCRVWILQFILRLATVVWIFITFSHTKITKSVPIRSPGASYLLSLNTGTYYNNVILFWRRQVFNKFYFSETWVEYRTTVCNITSNKNLSPKNDTGHWKDVSDFLL
jgi:hypothetical protein